MEREPVTTWRARRQKLAAYLAKHGAIDTTELHALGFSRTAIGQLVIDKLLVREHHGVYRSPAAWVDDTSKHRGMLLAAGKGSSLARVSSSWWQGFLDYPPPEPQIVVPTRHGLAKRDGFHVHKAPALTEADVITVRELPCTTPAYTVIDLAAYGKTKGDERILKRTLRQATVADPGLPAYLQSYLEEHRPFYGCRALDAALELHRPETLIQRSGLEGDFIELCLEYGIPLPETNAIAAGHEVDTLWRNEHVYGELDTYGTHGGVREFEADRRKDAELAAAGFLGIRITRKRVDHDRPKLAAQTLSILALRS